MTMLLIARDDGVFVADSEDGSVTRAEGLDDQHPMCLAARPALTEGAFCGTRDDGVFRSRDGGRSWTAGGLDGHRIMSLAVGRDGSIWAGAEPSRVWRSLDGSRWRETSDPSTLPSSSEWAFPPRPETHHVRWIACHPEDPERLWAAVEAGALIHTRDGGDSWHDREPDGPRDTHELTIHPEAPSRLLVAAGDGMFIGEDGGRSWRRAMDGLEVGYMRSIALDPGDPEVMLVSGASAARRAYTAGRSDGRVYRRAGSGPWMRVQGLGTDPPDSIAPLLRSGTTPGQLWAADERGVHRSDDAGVSWAPAVAFESAPRYLTGLVAC